MGDYFAETLVISVGNVIFTYSFLQNNKKHVFKMNKNSVFLNIRPDYPEKCNLGVII
jgi:hypothetical protein